MTTDVKKYPRNWITCQENKRSKRPKRITDLPTDEFKTDEFERSRLQ